MKKIFKYGLEPVTVIDLPKDAEILTVQNQNGTPQMWVLLDPDAPTVKRTFLIYGTGHNFDMKHYRYEGTFQLESGVLVFHVFESLAT